MRRRLGLLLAALPTLAGAEILSGEVTGGTALEHGGRFVELEPDNRFTVGRDNFQEPHLHAFNEDQNIGISSPIEVDLGTAPQEGDVVASHYVFFDPKRALHQTGHVLFDAPIYGVATGGKTMKASDYLFNSAVTYLATGNRGLEGGDKVWIDPDNPARLMVDWRAASPGDYVRVFTRYSKGAAGALYKP